MNRRCLKLYCFKTNKYFDTYYKQEKGCKKSWYVFFSVLVKRQNANQTLHNCHDLWTISYRTNSTILLGSPKMNMTVNARDSNVRRNIVFKRENKSEIKFGCPVLHFSSQYFDCHQNTLVSMTWSFFRLELVISHEMLRFCTYRYVKKSSPSFRSLSFKQKTPFSKIKSFTMILCTHDNI